MKHMTTLGIENIILFSASFSVQGIKYENEI